VVAWLLIPAAQVQTASQVDISGLVLAHHYRTGLPCEINIAYLALCHSQNTPFMIFMLFVFANEKRETGERPRLFLHQTKLATVITDWYQNVEKSLLLSHPPGLVK